MSRSASAVISVERFFELSLLGLIASGYLAVAGSGYLDAPTAALGAIGLAVRVMMVTGVVDLRLSNRLVGAATVAYIVFYPLDYAFISKEFLPATVHMVFFLAVVKILTARTNRDFIFLAIVAFLQLLAASVLSTSMNFFLFLALFLVFAVAAFASSEIRRSVHRPRRIARAELTRFHWRLAALTCATALGILVLTGGLFFLLPRTAQAAFRRLVPQQYHLPGFSNEVTLGQIGEIQQRRTPVMHVRLNSLEQPLNLKWRGAALSRFDGRRWYNPPDPPRILKVNDGMLELADKSQQRRAGIRFSYDVQLNAVASDALFFAGTPEYLFINSPTVVRTATDSYRLGFGLSEPMRYGAYSYLEKPGSAATAQDVVPAPALAAMYLQLPVLDPRIPALAKSVTAGEQTADGRARALERYLRTQYTYTLQLLSEEVPDPLAHFLFDRRKGHCEYFASAMAVMLRTIGIPARVTNGFQSGVYNPVSGWYVIRTSDAHSWVEAWLPGHGWSTFDPTPPDLGRNTLSIWSRMAMYLDAADTFWQEWVLNYDLNRQIVLASKMESSGRSVGLKWVDRLRASAAVWNARGKAALSAYGGIAVAFAVIAVAAWLFGPKLWAWVLTHRRVRKAQRGNASAPDATLFYRRMLVMMKRRGYEKPAWVTPTEFARNIGGADTAGLVREFTAAYNELRFGGNPGAAPRMMQVLSRLEHS